MGTTLEMEENLPASAGHCPRRFKSKQAPIRYCLHTRLQSVLHHKSSRAATTRLRRSRMTGLEGFLNLHRQNVDPEHEQDGIHGQKHKEVPKVGLGAELHKNIYDPTQKIQEKQDMVTKTLNNVISIQFVPGISTERPRPRREPRRSIIRPAATTTVLQIGRMTHRMSFVQSWRAIPEGGVIGPNPYR